MIILCCEKRAEIGKIYHHVVVTDSDRKNHFTSVRIVREATEMEYHENLAERNRVEEQSVADCFFYEVDMD